MQVKTRNRKLGRTAQKARGRKRKIKTQMMSQRLKDRLAHLDEY
jgi:hypothetical protein